MSKSFLGVIPAGAVVRLILATTVGISTSTPEAAQSLETIASVIDSYTADHCSELRLDDLNSALSKIPVHNQFEGVPKSRQVGICYAIEAAILIDAYRFSYGDRRFEYLTSPLSVAAHYVENLDDTVEKNHESVVDGKFLGPGDSALAILHSMQKTVCDHNVARAWYRESLFESTALPQADAASAVPPLSDFIKGIVSSSPSEDPRTAAKAVREHMRKRCGDKEFVVDFPNPRFYDRVDSSGNGPLDMVRGLGIIIQTAHLLMNNGGQPIGIDFCRDILVKDREFVGIQDFADGYRVACATHAAVITGRRHNSATKRCEYLVRDSAGGSCVDSNGKQKFKWDCENGGAWVSASALARNTQRLVWIPAPSTTSPAKKTSPQ